MVSDEIATYLAGAGLGLTLGTNLYDVPFPIGPGQPDAAVAVMEPPVEEKAEDTFGGSLAAEAISKPHFRIEVRDKDPGAAKTTMWSVFKKVRNLSATLSGVRYLQIDSLGQPAFLKFDDNQRAIYYAEFRAWKEESP